MGIFLTELINEISFHLVKSLTSMHSYLNSKSNGQVNL